MGLLDLFSRKPTPKKIERLKKRMLNEHHQAQVRQESMEELIAFGTPEALLAFIARLGVNFRQSTVNEQEKRYVSDVLVERFGDDAVEPLITFIRGNQTISAAIRVLARLVSESRLLDVLLETIASYEPMDHRTIDARLQLVDALADHDDPRIPETLMPYTADHDDDVRIKVMEVLEQKATGDHPQHDAAVAALCEVIKDPEASGRITRRACQALMGLDGDVGAQAMDLVEFLPDGYTVDDRGRLQGG